MKTGVSKIAIGLIGSALIATGCQTAAPPPRIAVPDRTQGNPNATYEHDVAKPLPLPGDSAELPPPPYADEPLVNQHPPEQRAFIDSYNRVGHPRVAVLVNPQLKDGSEDELAARSIDYAAMETILADWLGADGHVTLIAASAARQHLSDQQVKQLQSGDPNAQKQIADQLATDVVVEVQVQPTRQAGQPAARLVAEAVNVRGGQSIARAVVDVPPPLEKVQINRYTRFVARKLMDEMTATWTSMPPTPAQPQWSPSPSPQQPANPVPPTAPQVVPPAAQAVPPTPAAPPAPTQIIPSVLVSPAPVSPPPAPSVAQPSVSVPPPVAPPVPPVAPPPPAPAQSK